MRKIILGLIFFNSILMNGQNQIQTNIPVLSPQTPTTSSLGQYGEIQVNEATGLISPSIPLFEYYAGKINLPITLNYSGNGVKVNQSPTWLGINWNLNAGGVITRVVRDRPDELTLDENRLYFSEAELDDLPGKSQLVNVGAGLFDTNTVWYKTIEQLTENAVDSEADIFNYNFLGFSGSFFLDKNNIVHLIKFDKELSITFNFTENNNSSFMIKTPDGDTFFFGGDSSEISKSWVNVGAGSSNTAIYTQNAFYLTQIGFLNGGNITFEYDKYNLNGVCLSKIGIVETGKFCTGSSGSGTCNKKIQVLSNQIYKFIKMRKIKSSFNDQYVEFNTTILKECAGIYKLNSVSLKNINDVMLKKIELNYITIDKEIEYSDNKFFLESVNFYGQDNLFINNYALLYDSLDLLPNRDSFAQDELGYFNGNTNNTTLLPLLESYTHVNFLCENLSLANREANLAYCKIGSLKEIRYPTKGTSSFEYELPYKSVSVLTEPKYLNLYYRDEYRNYSSSPHTKVNNYNIYSNGIYFPVEGEHFETTTSSNITVNISTTINGTFSHPIYLKIKAINTNGTISNRTFTVGSAADSYSNQIFNHLHTFNLPPGTYTFKFNLEIHCADSHACSNNIQQASNSILTTAILNFPNGTKQNYYPGLRIKKIIKNNNNGAQDITRYYYNNLIKKDLESYVFQPSFVYITKEPISGSFSLSDCFNIGTNSVKATYHSGSSFYTYPAITISYGGDNFQNGGKEIYFHSYNDYQVLTYDLGGPFGSAWGDVNFSGFLDYGTNHASHQNSVIKSEKIFNSQLITQSEIRYNYESVLNTLINNIKPYRFVSGRIAPLIDDFVYMTYQTKSFKYRLVDTETKEYFNNSLIPITSKVTNSYNNPDKVSLPSAIITRNSNSYMKETYLYYPSDTGIIRNLTNEDITNLNLLQNNKYNIAQIVKTESLINGNLLDSKQITFGNFQGNILTKMINSKKRGLDPFEERIHFHSYNYHGKPTLVSAKNGTTTRYTYNNNQQVLLKIEYADLEENIDDNLNPSNIPCYFQQIYPDSMITQYEYDPLTNNLISITDSKCDKITYHYDPFGRLQYVKDKDGNILSENEYHYKP